EMPDPRSKNIYQRHRQHEFPREIHQLIDSQPGQCPADPNEQRDQAEKLQEEPDIRWNPFEGFKRSVPAAEEERDSQSTHRKKSNIFAQKKEGEFEAGIFDIIPGNDLGFAFRKIKR